MKETMRGIFAAFILVTSLGLSAEAPNENGGAVVAREHLQRVYQRKLGGFVTKPGSEKGSVCFVNAQNKLGRAEIDAVVANLKKQLKHKIVVVDGQQEGLPTRDKVNSLGATVAVFVVDDCALPPTLVATEDRWALVNVARMSDGLRDDVAGRRFFARRVRGELMRAFSLLCGGGCSTFKGNVYGATDVRSLDAMDVDALVVDMFPRYEAYLSSLGVTPAYTVPYSRACAEGWAPAPTNEYQKAVRERVRSKLSKEPTNGLKIEYNPEIGR